VPELLRILADTADSWRPPPGAKFFAVGGARVSPTLLERATAAGLPVFEGYGLSECASVVCLNTPSAARPGSVGRPLPHARLRIDARGEIHVGGAVMSGYVGAPDAAGTEIATGDLGAIDDEGFVHVNGRLKNLFINSYGRNLSPEWIESELAQEAAIGQAVVFGEARPSVVALIVPAAPRVPAVAIAQALSRANARLPAYARVARYHVASERFSPANGLLTGNGRLRRERVLERYADTIQRLHADAEFVPARPAHG
jgi:long-subunit acyl-CoA synthetase (AMP-forming)